MHKALVFLYVYNSTLLLAVFTSSYKIKPWAGQNLNTGRVWPVGQTLDMPVLTHLCWEFKMFSDLFITLNIVLKGCKRNKKVIHFAVSSVVQFRVTPEHIQNTFKFSLIVFNTLFGFYIDFLTSEILRVYMNTLSVNGFRGGTLGKYLVATLRQHLFYVCTNLCTIPLWFAPSHTL